ncbi:ATP-dependent helicase [Paenibacillus sp. HB172176]|uniref:ATP-dependent helicase n=1 Tax=Paenibacillus sp. HB172176 TaxID=2493690 RepID=UPI00143AFDDD|nr:ATP-dependent helicase [Paenibacillus sp. HB172176]
MKTDKTDFLERKKAELGVALNDVQREAVLRTDGPMLLLASPGSGKTTTLIMRIGYLIEEKGVRPARIKAVTFSRASAGDMKERFKRFFPMRQPVDFSTIHSLAFEVVRERCGKTATSYLIIEGASEPERDRDGQPLMKTAILRNLYKRMTKENITEDQLEAVSTYISFVKNKLIPQEAWGTIETDIPYAEQLLREYEEYKSSAHYKLLLDFDDMLTLANEALEQDANLLRGYQERYDYILTDESQDTSLVQHALVEKLAREHRNLCVVADDDQSIYSWRGAEPAYLLDFKKVYPEAATLFMEQNYRSSKEIVETANLFIKRNKNRYPKNMFTNNESAEPIALRSLGDYRDQAKYLAEQLQGAERLGECAILYRNNSSSITLINAFDRAGIPFYMKDADNRFFSHWVVEDMLNFMRMSFTDRRPEILEGIHLKFNGYISKHQMAALKSIDNQESVFDNLLRYVHIQDYQKQALTDAKNTFEEMRGMPPLPAIQVIRRRLGYEKALEKMCERMGYNKDYLIGVLNTLEDIADELDSMEAFAARLKHLEHELRNAKRRKGQNAVTLSTFHSSKGLEFDRVYMIDLIKSVIPTEEDIENERDGDGSLMEEAARLFYVGMTRARKRLELVAYSSRNGARCEESSFMRRVRAIIDPPKPAVKITEGRHSTKRLGRDASKPSEPAINPNAIRERSALSEGMAIRHRVFGPCVIEALEADHIHIRISENNVKRLSLSMCLERGLLEAAAE